MSDLDSSESIRTLTPAQALLAKYPLKENPYVRLHKRGANQRAIFGAKEKVFSSIEAETDNLIIATDVYKHYYKVTEGKAKASLGQSIGKNLVRFLDRLDLPQSGPLTQEQINSIKRAHTFYKNIFSEDYQGIRTGFLAEYASMRSISDCLKNRYVDKFKNNQQLMPHVEYPTKDEDLNQDIDFWINLEGITNERIAVQVKCYSFNNSPQAFIFPLENEQNENNLFNILKLNMKNPHELARVDYDEEMKKLSTLRETNANIKCLYIILPSPDSEMGQFHTEYGLPTPDMTRKFSQELNETILKRV